jgi:protein subunit release factor A
MILSLVLVSANKANTMREMLDEKLKRFEELEQQLSDPEVQSNSSKMAAVARASLRKSKKSERWRAPLMPTSEKWRKKN